MLDGRKMRLIEAKLQYPNMGNNELAEIVGVSRQSIWNWLTKDEEVKAHQPCCKSPSLQPNRKTYGRYAGACLVPKYRAADKKQRSAISA